MRCIICVEEVIDLHAHLRHDHDPAEVVRFAVDEHEARVRAEERVKHLLAIGVQVFERRASILARRILEALQPHGYGPFGPGLTVHQVAVAVGEYMDIVDSALRRLAKKEITVVEKRGRRCIWWRTR